MSDAVPVQKRIKELNISPRFTNHSKVIIHVDDENVFVVGDDSGRMLEMARSWSPAFTAGTRLPNNLYVGDAS